MPIARFGGSFAPPIEDKLDSYRAIAAGAEGEYPHVSEIMLKLCDMCDAFHETPASTNGGSPHPSGRGTIVPLEDAEIKRIWDHVPWKQELKMYSGVFDELPSGTREVVVTVEGPDGAPVRKTKSEVVDEKAYALRNAAFHLLWYATELEQDREPTTSDKL